MHTWHGGYEIEAFVASKEGLHPAGVDNLRHKGTDDAPAHEVVNKMKKKGCDEVIERERQPTQAKP